METVHCGEINPPPRRRKAAAARLQQGAGREFAKGEELGRFNMGSTVVLLFQRDRVRWEDRLAAERQGETRPDDRARQSARLVT